eukprot:6943158-Alexandrium_andersonii.AAC.1
MRVSATQCPWSPSFTVAINARAALAALTASGRHGEYHTSNAIAIALLSPSGSQAPMTNETAAAAMLGVDRRYLNRCRKEAAEGHIRFERA